MWEADQTKQQFTPTTATTLPPAVPPQLLCLHTCACGTMASTASRMPAEVLAELRRTPANEVCVDCPTRSPQWASATYGTLLCLKCSGVHRGMGVRISFVRSIQMDQWNDKQLRTMKVRANASATLTYLAALHELASQIGGNQRLLDFWKEHGLQDASAKEKYYSLPAAFYRAMIAAERDGTPPVIWEQFAAEHAAQAQQTQASSEEHASSDR